MPSFQCTSIDDATWVRTLKVYDKHSPRVPVDEARLQHVLGQLPQQRITFILLEAKEAIDVGWT
jgi:hypothetical protein